MCIIIIVKRSHNKQRKTKEASPNHQLEPTTRQDWMSVDDDTRRSVYATRLVMMMIMRLPRPLMYVIVKTKRGTMYEWVMGARQRPTSAQVSNQDTHRARWWCWIWISALLWLLGECGCGGYDCEEDCYLCKHTEAQKQECGHSRAKCSDSSDRCMMEWHDYVINVCVIV